MGAASEIPGGADARTKLFVVIGNILRDWYQMATCTGASVDHLSGNMRLSLGIPCAVPADTVSDREARRDLPFVLRVEANACLVRWLQLAGREGIHVVQTEALEIEVSAPGSLSGRAGGRIKITNRAVIVPARTPAGEDILAVHKGVDVAAKLHVVLREGVGEVVLNLELAVIVVARQVEALAKFTHASNEDFRRAREDRMTDASFALNQGAEFVDFRAEDRRQRENSTNALVDKILGITESIKGLRLAVAAGEATGMIPGAEATDAEVVCRRNLIVIMTKKDEEILELSARAFESMQVRNSIAAGEEMGDAGCNVFARRAQLVLGARRLCGDHRARRILAGGIAVAKIGGQRTVAALDVGG